MGKKILYFFLVLLTGLFAYWFGQNFSWVEEQKDIGFQGIAQRKPLLAAEFLLRKMGIQNKPVNGLVAFRNMPDPDTSQSILIATRRGTLNTELTENLLHWVKAGGHLIVEAQYCAKTGADKKQDFVFQLFGLCVTNSDADEESADIAVNTVIKKGTTIKVNFPYSDVLEQSHKKGKYTPLWTVTDNLGTYLEQYSFGQGEITVLTSTDIFSNEKIALYDHARLLIELLSQSDHNGEVWLVSVDDMPALWSWLWHHAWYVMFSLSLMLLFWLWRYPLRFGPKLDDEAMQRRRLMEHIQASGYYRWHHKQSAQLLAAVQEITWEKIQLLHPVIRREKPELAYRLLEEITQIKQTAIRRALSTTNDMNESEFENRVKLLVNIGNNL